MNDAVTTAYAPYAAARVAYDASQLLELIEVTTTRHDYNGCLVHEASFALAGAPDAPTALVRFESSIDGQSDSLEFTHFRVVGRCDVDEREYAAVDEEVDPYTCLLIASNADVQRRVRMDWADLMEVM